jgi:lipoate-protein ligase A
VKIVRRTTGGGTIYTDKYCLIYSLVFDKGNKDLKPSREIFENVCKSIVNTLKKFDIQTIYKAPNDILLNKKKISGSAQIKKDNIVLIHGTLIIDTNLELMNILLKKFKNVSTIRREIGYSPFIKDIKDELKKEFEIYFNTNFKKTTFSSYESNLIDKLLRERYLNDAWNFMR